MLFNLADCLENLVELERARALFDEVAEQARRANMPEREAIARERAAFLEAELRRAEQQARTLAAAPAPADLSAREPTASKHEGDHARMAKALRWSGIGAMSAGTGTLALAAILAVRAKSTFERSSDHCDGTGCDDRGVELREAAVHRGNVATASTVIGAALVIAGGVVFWTSREPAAPSERAVTLGLSLRGSGIALRGRF